MEIEIRRVTKAQLGLFERVAEDVFDEPVVPARLRAYLAAPGHLMLIAVAAGEVVAQVAAVIHRHPDKRTELYIDEVAVAPAYQRRGLAGRMLEEMYGWGRELGCEESWVGTEPDNWAARALYERGSGAAEPFVMYLRRL